MKHHKDTKECFEKWVEHLGLSPWHTNGSFESINMDKIDMYVILHGKERVIEALTACKTRSALQALSALDAAEMEIARQQLAKPKIDHNEVARLMGEM